MRYAIFADYSGTYVGEETLPESRPVWTIYRAQARRFPTEEAATIFLRSLYNPGGSLLASARIVPLDDEE